ncbi:hypothetical protein P7H16_22050 [Paenibacillus larvae]|nr:hypothetical protein [Paenibacillus larvae]MDT2249071.1 hypothetical protein [Paenibacillus larvae]MDT2255506.1 hypothetical protein [Paenibacillus larvae]
MTIWPSPSLWWIMAYSALAILLYGAINQWISVKKRPQPGMLSSGLKLAALSGFVHLPKL